MNPNDLFFILMNTSLRGQARFPTTLLPLIRLFQISIHGIGTVMNKKMSFKFNRTKPASDRSGREILCMQRVKQPTARNHAKHKLKKSMEDADRWNTAP